MPNVATLKAMMTTAGFESIDEISRFALEARADDAIHKVVLRGDAIAEPAWIRAALEAKAASVLANV